jgi:hypothetical protein
MKIEPLQFALHQSRGLSSRVDSCYSFQLMRTCTVNLGESRPANCRLFPIIHATHTREVLSGVLPWLDPLRGSRPTHPVLYPRVKQGLGLQRIRGGAVGGSETSARLALRFRTALSRLFPSFASSRSALNLNAAGPLLLFGLGHGHGQHTVLEPGLNLIWLTGPGSRSARWNVP